MVLKGVATNIRALLTDADGEPVEKGKEPEVEIVKDSTGKAIVEEGEAEVPGEDGVAVYELAAQETLDRFTVTWTLEGSTFKTVEEMVGLRLCSLAAVEENLSEALAAETKRTARDIAERFLEDECGVAFRPSYGHEIRDGDGSTKLYLPDPKVNTVRKIVFESGETEEELAAEELEEVKVYGAEGYLYRAADWPKGHKNVNVVYEHGFTDPPPNAGRAAAQLARHIAVARLSNLEDRATTYSTDDATYSLIQPGIKGNLTALPEVNSFIASWRFPAV